MTPIQWTDIYRQNAIAAQLAFDNAGRPGKATRVEFNRPSDLPLVALLRQAQFPYYANQISPGVFTIDLPAGVYKTLWQIGQKEFAVGTYQNALDRASDLEVSA